MQLVRYTNGIALVDGGDYREVLRRTYQDNAPDGSPLQVDKRRAPLPKDSALNRIPVGAWRLGEVGMYGRQVCQLVQLDPLRLAASEDVRAYMADVRLYAGWLQQGYTPPPVEVLQDWDGRLRLSDGHRRCAAAIVAGERIRAWVAWVVPTGGHDADGAKLYTPLTWELSAKLGRQPACPLHPARATGA